jgi:hypothetical protein
MIFCTWGVPFPHEDVIIVGQDLFCGLDGVASTETGAAGDARSAA